MAVGPLGMRPSGWRPLRDSSTQGSSTWTDVPSPPLKVLTCLAITSQSLIRMYHEVGRLTEHRLAHSLREAP